MTTIKELYKQKISAEIISLIDNTISPDIEKEQETRDYLDDIKEMIQDHPQKISRKEELEIYLDFINSIGNKMMSNLTKIDCETCALYSCNRKGKYKSTIGLCADYIRIKDLAEQREDEIKTSLGILSQLKEEKESELEEYDSIDKIIEEL